MAGKVGPEELPFYFCQIASFGAHTDKPAESQFAEVRESQTATLSVPNTGQAILIDIGEEGNIHPADRDSVGDRLSRLALAKTYGKTLVFSGPVYDSMTIEGGKVRVKFKHTEKGLVAKPMPPTYKPFSTDHKELPLVRNSPKGTVEGFAICGDDHKWKWATANIDGDTVVLESEEVPSQWPCAMPGRSTPFATSTMERVSRRGHSAPMTSPSFQPRSAISADQILRVSTV